MFIVHSGDPIWYMPLGPFTVIDDPARSIDIFREMRQTNRQTGEQQRRAIESTKTGVILSLRALHLIVGENCFGTVRTSFSLHNKLVDD